MDLTVFKQLYGHENRYMAMKTVIWPWKPLYGLENRYMTLYGFNGY